MRTSLIPAAAVTLTMAVTTMQGAVTDCLPGQRECLARLVRPHAMKAARDSVTSPDRFEAIAYRFGGADPVDGGRLAVDLLESEGPNASGIVRLRFRLRVDGVAAGEARATVRGRVLGEALIASRTLARGERVDRGGVELREVDLTRLREAPLRSPRELEGRVPSRTLGAGRILTPSLVEPRALVHRGDVVDVLLTRRRVSIKARGRALQDGAEGETVLAEVLPQGARLLTEVEADGTLRVVRPGDHR